MKILFFISSMQAGGAERVASILLAEFARRGHRIEVAQWSAKNPFYPLPEGVPLIRLDLNARRFGVFGALIAPFRRFFVVRGQIRKRRPDLVLSFLTRQNCYAALAAVGTGVPVIVSEHNHRNADIVGRGLGMLRALAYPLAAARVVLTEADRVNYARLEPVRVIPNPVDVPRTDGDEAKREQTILAVGRLSRQKGFDLLIDAFAALDDAAGYRLVIAGDGEERAALEARAAERGVSDQISFLGRVVDVYSLYRNAGFLVLSSRYEGFGMVLVEAMALGCPVVSFDCPFGPSDIVRHEENGLLVPAGDVPALTSAMRRMIHDGDLRARLAQAGEDVRERFALEPIADRWDALFSEIIKSST